MAWQDHEAAFYEHFLSSDHVESHPGGLAGKADVVEGVRAGCAVKSRAIDRFKVTRFSADAALVVYRGSPQST